jgi:DNA-binding response OmpR family regulator
MRILAIDDEAGILEVLKRFLTPRGYDVIAYSDSCKALSDVEDGIIEKVDIVVLDLRMPSVNGKTILKRIRETSRIPVIVLTGSLRGASDERLDADIVLSKPINIDILLQNIVDIRNRMSDV